MSFSLKLFQLSIYCGLVTFATWNTLVSLSPAQAPTSASQSGKETMNNPFILVNSDIPGGFLSASLVKDAESYVEVTSNLDKPEIGKYKGIIERTLYEQCDRELSEAGFTGLDSPKSLAPTVATITVGRGVGQDTSTIQMKTFPLREVPESLNRFLITSRKAIELVRAQKYRVLEGRAKCAHTKLRASDKLEFEVTVTNIGSEKALISNPVSSGSNLARITLEVTDANHQSATPKALEFTSNEVSIEPLSKSASASSSGPKLTLLADDGIVLKLKKTAFAKPGTYQAAITVHFVEVEPNNVTQVTGRLRLETDKFTIESN